MGGIRKSSRMVNSSSSLETTARWAFGRSGIESAILKMNDRSMNEERTGVDKRLRDNCHSQRGVLKALATGISGSYFLDVFRQCFARNPSALYGAATYLWHVIEECKQI